jgi:hypothetical protein
MLVPALSLQHFRIAFERTAGSLINLVESLFGNGLGGMRGIGGKSGLAARPGAGNLARTGKVTLIRVLGAVS